jgi:hypothetical protein
MARRPTGHISKSSHFANGVSWLLAVGFLSLYTLPLVADDCEPKRNRDATRDCSLQVDTRIRDFRANGLAIPFAVASSRRGCSSLANLFLANLFEESPGGDCRDGFLHRH